jgi:hypothetical protein
MEVAPPTLEELLERLEAAGWLARYRLLPEPPMWSGARPWSKVLRRLTSETIDVTQQLGVRYFPVRALITLEQEEPLSRPEQVLREVLEAGAVLAALPSPAWAIAVCAGNDPARLAWLTPWPVARNVVPLQLRLAR